MAHHDEGFYGTEHDTYYVTEAGRVWHVQSADGGAAREVGALPPGVGAIDVSDCHDLDLSATSAVEDRARASGWEPSHEITVTYDGGARDTWLVDLHEDEDGGPAYTAEEWDATASAAWGVDEEGCWNCEGQVTPGGRNGTVSVRTLPRAEVRQ